MDHSSMNSMNGMNSKFFRKGDFMTDEEIKDLAKWTAELWNLYKKYLRVDMQQWDFDRLLDELRRIWEESGHEPLIMDMGLAFADDLDRRCKGGQ